MTVQEVIRYREQTRKIPGLHTRLVKVADGVFGLDCWTETHRWSLR